MTMCTGVVKTHRRVRWCSPWESIPLWWWCNPEWRARQVGSSAFSHSRSPFCLRIETLLSDWPPAAWPPSSSLWHRRSVSGKWLPWAPPCGTSSSQSLQRSGSTLLQSWRRPSQSDASVRSTGYRCLTRYQKFQETMNFFSPGVYPFLSILALKEIGPEVQNQQQRVLSFVPACGDWKKERIQKIHDEIWIFFMN